MKTECKVIVTIFSNKEQSYLEPKIYTGTDAKQFLKNIPSSWMFESQYKNFENYTNMRGDNINIELIGF